MQVYGPHTAALYTRRSALIHSLHSLAHYFITAPDQPSKLQLGGPGYELTYAVSGVLPYLLSLPSPSLSSSVAAPSADAAPSLERAFESIMVHENALSTAFLSYLAAPKQWDRGVRIVGSQAIDAWRIPTISFLVTGEGSGPAIKCKEVVGAFDQASGVCTSSWLPISHLYRFSGYKDWILTTPLSGGNPLRPFLCRTAHRLSWVVRR
jgi:hypothetical protein